MAGTIAASSAPSGAAIEAKGFVVEGIERVAARLRAQFADEGSGHDWYHLERVWRLARRIGESGLTGRLHAATLASAADSTGMKYDAPASTVTLPCRMPTFHAA